MENILGIDISKWQLRDTNHNGKLDDPCDWDSLTNIGVKFAVCKATHGKWSQDPSGFANWKPMEGKVLRGLYHWITGDDPKQQVDYFLKTAEQIGWTADDLPLTIDFEEPKIGMQGSQLIDHLRKIIDLIKTATNKPVILYSGNWYWKQYCLDIDAPDLIDASIIYWHAQYPRLILKNSTDYSTALGTIDHIKPDLPLPWSKRGIKPSFWQFDGDKGLTFPNGIDSDFNIFYGSYDDLIDITKARLSEPDTCKWKPGDLPPGLDWTPEEVPDYRSVIDNLFKT